MRAWRALGPTIALGFAACSFLVDSEDLAPSAAAVDASAAEASNADDAPPSGSDAAAEAATDGGPAALSAYARAVLEDQPLAYFRFDEPSGPTARDTMGKYDATYAGAVEFGAAGAIADGNGAIRFPGNTVAYVDLGADLHFAGLPFTIEFWLYPEIIDAEYRRILLKVDPDDAGASGWVLHVNDSVGLIAELLIKGNATWAGSAFMTNRYTHVALSFDTVTLRMYVDGIVTSTGVVDGALPATAANLVVGMHPGGWNFFKGRVDELAFYGTALPASRIQAHIAAALP